VAGVIPILVEGDIVIIRLNERSTIRTSRAGAVRLGEALLAKFGIGNPAVYPNEIRSSASDIVFDVSVHAVEHPVGAPEGSVPQLSE